MSDFLANLLARSFSSVEIIRPRIPARFAVLPVDAAWAEPDATSATMSTPAPHETPPARAPAPHVIGEELPPSTARSPVMARVPATRVEASELDDQTSFIREPPQAPALASGVPLAQTALRDRAPAPVEQTTVAPAPSKQGAVASVAERGDLPPPEAQPIETLLQLSEPPAPQPLQPNVIRVAPAPQVQPAIPPPITAGPPRINITIGRVEVRALPPNAPPPRPRSAQPGPPLSLDAYLKRRDGGGS